MKKRRRTAGGSRNHGSDDDAISREVAKGLKPTRAVVGEGIPLKEGSAERVCIVNILLKIFIQAILEVRNEHRRFLRR